MKLYYLGLFFVVILSIITILPLFHEGFFPFHDSLQVARVYEMNQALHDGVFPVRVVRDLGYGFGYAIFNFYAPLSYYIGGIISFIFQPLIATKIMIGICMIFSGISMYILSRQFLRTSSAMVASLLYLFAPYHALNLYVRGAVSELYAYAMIPLVFYALVRVYKRPSYGSLILVAISLSGVILSHNLTAMMLIPYYAVCCLFLLYKSTKIKKSSRGYLIVGILLGLGLSCFYWLPAFMEKGFANLASVLSTGSIYKENFVCLAQLWNSPWNFGGSLPGCVDALSFQVGKIHILLAVIGVLLLGMRSPYRKYLIFSLAGAFVSAIMTLQISQPLWDAVSLLRYVQFPWRFLGFLTFFLSLAGGFVFQVLKENKIFIHYQKYVGIGGVVVIVLLISVYYVKFFTPQYYIKQYENQTQRDILVWNVSFLSDEYLPASFVKPKSLAGVPNSPILSKQSKIVILRHTSTTLNAKILSPVGDTLIINKTTYPFWQFHLDSERVMPDHEGGRYSLQVTPGQHELSVSFASTFTEKLGNSISLISLAIALLGIMYTRRNSQHAKTT